MRNRALLFILALTGVAVVWLAGCGDDDNPGNQNNNSAGCGDGVVGGDEACDGEDVQGETCEALGYHGGQVLCTSDCTLDISVCELVGRCGDGYLQEPHEQCDGSDLSDAPCAVVDPIYGHGALICNDDCTFDLTDCSVCGDGVWESSEPCEDGNDTLWDGCNDCEISEFRVWAGDATGLNFEPVVGFSATGACVVGYFMEQGGTTNTVVQHYNAEGVPSANASALGSDILRLGSVAMHDSGWFLAAYIQRQTGSVVVQRYTASAQKDATPILVDTDPLVVGVPSVAVTPDGTFIVAWTKDEGSSGWDADLYFQIFGPDGTPSRAATLVGVDPAGDQRDPRVAVSDSGRIWMAWWHEEDQVEQIRARLFDPLGEPDGPTLELFTAGDDDIDGPRLATAADGRAVVVWSHDPDPLDNDLYAQLLTAAGALDGSPIFVVDDSSIFHTGPGVTMADDGSFEVTWGEVEILGLDDYMGYGVAARWFDAQGLAQGPKRILSRKPDILAFGVGTAGRHGRFVVAWVTYVLQSFHVEIFGQRFDDQGIPLGLNPW
jgi:cysteine-rich repeat protein